MSRNDVGAERRTRLASARLYLVCEGAPGGRELPDLLHAAIAGGVEVVQLRDKHLPDDALAAVAHAAHALCERLGALLIVNDRPTVALQIGADGVHVGQDDMPVEEVRELVGPDLLIGLSTHAPAEVDAALAKPAVDYLGVGPVYATPTKPGRPAVGLALVGHAAASASKLTTAPSDLTTAPKPFFAIGGIDTNNVAAVVAAGARRIAVVRAIADADNPEQAAQTLSAELQKQPLESDADVS